MITIIHFIVITRPEAEHICSFFLSQSVYSMQQARIVPIAFFTTLAQNGNQLGCTSCMIYLYRMQRVPTYEPFDTAQVRPPCLHGRPALPRTAIRSSGRAHTFGGEHLLSPRERELDRRSGSRKFPAASMTTIIVLSFSRGKSGGTSERTCGAGNPGQLVAGQRNRVTKFSGEAKERLGETSFNRFVKHAPLVFELFKTLAKQSQCFLREPVLQILGSRTTNVDP